MYSLLMRILGKNPVKWDEYGNKTSFDNPEWGTDNCLYVDI